MRMEAISAAAAPEAYAPARRGADRGFAAALEKAQQNAQSAQSTGEDEKLKAVCKDFEAVFLNFMYAKMRETVPENTLIGVSQGEKIMQSMLDEELTKNMANAGGIGLAAMIYQQLSSQNYNGKR